MANLGYAALVLAFALSTVAALSSALVSRVVGSRMRNLAGKTIWAAFALASVAVFCLVFSLVAHDFSVRYVADYSSRQTPLPYLVSGLWAGNAGSLLFWAWLNSLFAVAFLELVGKRQRTHFVALAVVTACSAFFLFLSMSVANPFERLSPVPPDGYGLNPLLENPGMLVHPLMLLGGYVALTVPYALAVGGLAGGKVNEDWASEIRPWALLAWLLLGTGNLVGAWWAYVELGWGGYWAWDPVENAGLMPWLLSTALLHSLSMQRRHGTFRSWSLWLAVIAYLLAVFGTFLTRTGVLSSVHAFAGSGTGPFLIVLMAAILAVPVWLFFTRRVTLAGETESDLAAPRERVFALNNLLLAGGALLVLVGTLFPLFSRAFGRTVEVGAAFFNSAVGPIFIGTILLAGVCAMVGRRGRQSVLRVAAWPVGSGIVAMVLMVAFGIRSLPVLFVCLAAVLVTVSISLNLVEDVRVAGKAAGQMPFLLLARLATANRSKYGGYVVHLGIALLAVGVAVSSSYSTTMNVTLNAGESFEMAGLRMAFKGIEEYQVPGKTGVKATLSVVGETGNRMTLSPLQYFDPKMAAVTGQRQWATEVAISSTPLRDVYVILIAWDGSRAAFRVMVHPLVMWMWIGGGIAIAGGMFAFWPAPRRVRALEVELAERRNVEFV